MLSTIIAFLYEFTFRGLSYSRGLVQSMILGSIISCLLMISIGDNIARGIGIVGSLAIIRFRTNLRDPRDLIFVFASLGIGVAAGVQSFATAMIGTMVFCLAVLALSFSPFGSRRKHDGLLRFQVPADSGAIQQVTTILQQNTRHFAMITVRDVAQGEFYDYAYQVKLYKSRDNQRLVSELENVDGIRGLSYTNQEATVEV